MHFTETTIAGVVLAEPDVFEDQRGLFAVAWMPEEFAARGLETRIAQASLALTRERGSIRGMHFQVAPFEEAKVIRVVRGAVFDVAVDLRPDSPTFLQWVGAELTADNRRVMYISPGSPTATRRWSTTPKCSTSSRRRIPRHTSAVCAGTIRRSGSSGRSVRHRAFTIAMPPIPISVRPSFDERSEARRKMKWWPTVARSATFICSA
jgi:dTDP-4-dehydrorhamnose 3,5-epimerase-like enzyme